MSFLIRLRPKVSCSPDGAGKVFWMWDKSVADVTYWDRNCSLRDVLAFWQ